MAVPGPPGARYIDAVPIVPVTALAADPETLDRVLARVVTDVASALGCPPDDLWASYVPAAAQHVGPRRAASGRQCPVVVIRGRARTPQLVTAGLAAAARAVAAELDVPAEDVWLQWLDVLPGQAYAGGGPL